jgi:hypothetical protein
MKLFIRTPGIVIGFWLSALLLTGCGGRERRLVVPLTQFEERQPFVATVDILYTDQLPDSNMVLRDIVIIGVRTASGEKFNLSNVPGTESDVLVGFARTLQKGKSYEFPKEWLDYKAKLKR